MIDPGWMGDMFPKMTPSNFWLLKVCSAPLALEKSWENDAIHVNKIDFTSIFPARGRSKGIFSKTTWIQVGEIVVSFT